MNAIHPTTQNPGIVPPWLTKPAPVAPGKRNPGIVPPWLTKPAQPGDRNPGIVPPWLVPDTPRILPVAGDDVPTILPVTHNASVATAFARETAIVSPPQSMVDVIRSR